MEPIITRIKEPRTVELHGETFIAAETVYLDYRDGKGITTVYIREPVPGSPAALERVVAGMGYRLIRPEG